jgi:hypothetical protein
VKNDVSLMEMVHHQDVTVELSRHMLASQRKIETLRFQLWNLDATIQDCQSGFATLAGAATAAARYGSFVGKTFSLLVVRSRRTWWTR